MSNFGRKSIVAKEQAKNEFLVQGKKEQKESYHAYIIDICGAHHPKSEYYEKSFYEGIVFLLAIKELAEVCPVYWRQGYDLLRSVYGVDENIIGRQCIVHSKSSSKRDIFYGDLEIGIGLDNYYQDELTNTYISTGWMGGIPTNSSSLKNFMTNRTAGPGEIWFRFKK